MTHDGNRVHVVVRPVAGETVRTLAAHEGDLRRNGVGDLMLHRSITSIHQWQELLVWIFLYDDAATAESTEGNYAVGRHGGESCRDRSAVQKEHRNLVSG